jgi:hypothetical protein
MLSFVITFYGQRRLSYVILSNAAAAATAAAADGLGDNGPFLDGH